MTDTEALKALVELAKKFRPGRWMPVSDWNRYAVMEENHPHERFVCTFNQKPISLQGRKSDPIDYCGADKTTAEFIAAAKNAIPALERLLASQGKPEAEAVPDLTNLRKALIKQLSRDAYCHLGDQAELRKAAEDIGVFVKLSKEGPEE